jgi:hypothetical protein
MARLVSYAYLRSPLAIGTTASPKTVTGPRLSGERYRPMALTAPGLPRPMVIGQNRSVQPTIRAAAVPTSHIPDHSTLGT